MRCGAVGANSNSRQHVGHDVGDVNFGRYVRLGCTHLERNNVLWDYLGIEPLALHKALWCLIPPCPRTCPTFRTFLPFLPSLLSLVAVKTASRPWRRSSVLSGVCPQIPKFHDIDLYSHILLDDFH